MRLAPLSTIKFVALCVFSITPFTVSVAPELTVRVPELSKTSQAVTSSVKVKSPSIMTLLVVSGAPLLQTEPFHTVKVSQLPEQAVVTTASLIQSPALPEMVLNPEPARYVQKFSKLQTEREVLLTIYSPTP